MGELVNLEDWRRLRPRKPGPIPDMAALSEAPSMADKLGIGRLRLEPGITVRVAVIQSTINQRRKSNILSCFMPNILSCFMMRREIKHKRTIDLHDLAHNSEEEDWKKDPAFYQALIDEIKSRDKPPAK